MNFAQPVYSRPDGTFVVQYNSLPYHVTSDNTSAVSLAEVQAWATANPSLVSSDPGVMSVDQKAQAGIMTLADYQSYAYNLIDQKVQSNLASGFAYNSQTVPCDPTSQANLTSETVAMVAGILTYPVSWDLGGGNSMSITDQTSLVAFATAMKFFVQTCYANGITAKASVKAATTPAMVQSAYQAFVG